MGDARSAARPSSPPRSAFVQELERLLKGVCKRTAQPAGPPPCWSSRLEGARGSSMFKECQGLVGGISWLADIATSIDLSGQTHPARQAPALGTVKKCQSLVEWSSDFRPFPATAITSGSRQPHRFARQAANRKQHPHDSAVRTLPPARRGLDWLGPGLDLNRPTPP